MAMTGDSSIDQGDAVEVQAALSRQFSVGSYADIALAPVMESSHQELSADSNGDLAVANTGESVILVSPGGELTWGSFILEGLVQFPVWQDYEGAQTERSTSVLLGIRLMN